MIAARLMIAELEAIALHARRAKRALEALPIDRVDARTELAYIIAVLPQLRNFYEELGKPSGPVLPPAT
jgi:hypothetical protein